MKVCGIEIKANEAIICLLNLDQGLFDILDCRTSRVSLRDVSSAEQLKQFQRTFAKLMEDYGIDTAVIRARPLKGKFQGAAGGFKIEAALQLIETLSVEVLEPKDIKEQLKKTPLPVEFSQTGLKAYQEPAFVSAYSYLSARP